MPDTNQPVLFGASHKIQNLFRQVYGRLDVLEDFNPAKSFGAVGDGVADDTAALQAWLDAGGGYLNPGNYRIKASLVVDGEAQIFGAGVSSHIIIEETTNYLGPAANQICPIVFGVDTTWTGFMRDIRITFDAPMSFQCYVLVMISTRRSVIERIIFEELEAIGGSVITAYFSGLNIPFTTIQSQTDIDVLYNNARYTTNNIGMEFSSNNVLSSHWRWIGNTANGYGDDFIAVRGDNFTIRDNYGVGGGRIVPASVKYGTIVNNTLIKRASNGNSAGILLFAQVAVDAGTQPNFEACQDIIISGNQIRNEDLAFNLVSPIEVRGGTKITISDNHIIDTQVTGEFTVKIIPETVFTTYYPLGDISIIGNILTGGKFDIGGNDPGFPSSLVMKGNTVDGAGIQDTGYQFSDPNDEARFVFDGNIAHNVTDQPYNIDTTSLGGPKLLYQALNVVDQPVTLQAVGPPGFEDYYMESDSFLTNVRLLFSSPPLVGGTIRFSTVDAGVATEYATVPFAITSTVQDIVNYSVIGNLSRFIIQQNLGLRIVLQPSGGSLGGIDVLAHVGFNGL